MSKMPASKVIRLKCLDCSESKLEVKECWNKDCALYPYRMVKGSPGGSKLGAIKKYCLDCCIGSYKEVKHCEGRKCPLHAYRFGKKPETMRKKLNPSDENID